MRLLDTFPMRHRFLIAATVFLWPTIAVCQHPHSHPAETPPPRDQQDRQDRPQPPAPSEQEPPATPSPHGTAGETMPAHSMTGVLGISGAREGSGTSWLPDASPMHAVHGMRGRWQTMLHGNAFLQYLDEGSERGDEDFGSINWAMVMARQPLGAGELSVRGMFSLEPATMGECGYPVLLATGETCEGGRLLHDRQHPHDFFMELAGIYRRPITPHLAVEGYAALAGEPALGPTAYPHRPSALANPVAPIGHHWLHATHISFGVLTAGVFERRWKAEASAFNGREPDEARWNLDLDTLDSYSGRLWWLPNERWAVQVSAGHLEEAEIGEPGERRVDVDRRTASAIYHRPLGDSLFLTTTVAWGRNEEEQEVTDALLGEASIDLDHRNTVFGRAELVEKTGHDLVLGRPGLDDQVFEVSTLLVGWALQTGSWGDWRPGVGIKLSVSRLPEGLEPFYGTRTPVGWGVFASFRPATMGAHEAPSGH